jgi:hypothetical protein
MLARTQSEKAQTTANMGVTLPNFWQLQKTVLGFPVFH